MLYTPIRYIDDGEPLDQETLNRGMYDAQENMEELFRRITSLNIVGEVTEIPDTFVLRDQYGTSQFAPPRVGTNPLRLDDASIDAVPDSIVKRDQNGTASFSEPTANPHPIRQGDVVDNLNSTETNRPLSANQGRILDERVNSTEDYIDASNVNTFGSIGQTFFVDENNTPNSFSPDYTLISDPSIVETTEELITQEEFVSDFRRVFDSWKRFSHYNSNGDGGPQPVNPNEINAWSYDEEENRLLSTVNSSSIIGFVSPDVHENYTLQSLVSSDDSDDDFIGLCAAFVSNSGYESAIYVSRTVGAGNIANFNQFGGGLFNIVAQITTESGTQFIPIAKINGGLKWGDGVVDDSRDVENGAYGGWEDWYGCVIRIDRNGDEFTCSTSNLMADENDSRAFVDSATVTFSLNDDPRLSIFKGKQSYGYVSFSQRNSTWVSDIRPAPIQTVYNMETSEIWKWNGSQFQVDNSVNIDDIFDIGRFYHNELTRQLYYYHHENGLRILRGAVGDGLTGTGTVANPTRIKVSERSGNIIQLGNDGLYVGIEAPADVSVLYVSGILGDDSNPGTREQPLKTLHEALVRTPESSSTAIRLRAGETHEFGERISYWVSGATRIIEAYDDPYIDGNMVPTTTNEVWYYDWKYVEEVNRPVLELKWNLINQTVGHTLTKILCRGGGTWEFRGIDIKRPVPPTGSLYGRSSYTIAGMPQQYNGSLQFYGCLFTDLLDDGDPNLTMFVFRGDSGTLSLSFQATKINIPSYKGLFRLGGMALTLTINGVFNPTPVAVSGITPFSDNLRDVASSMIKEAIVVNGVYINLLTNVTP